MWWGASVPRMYSALLVRSARTMPKLVRNSSAASRSGERSRPYARSVALMDAIAQSSCVRTLDMLDQKGIQLQPTPDLNPRRDVRWVSVETGRNPDPRG